jgi:deazaflavin-dependent oxidoreductase (nitroreductase family)
MTTPLVGCGAPCTDEPDDYMNKRRISRALGKYAVNPAVRLVAGFIPWWSLLETTGRKTGRPWRNPVGNGLDGNTFWIVAEHGHEAGYIKNIKANPRVRLRVGGRWRSGLAHVLEDDDARARQAKLGQLNAAFVRLMGTELLTVRVDLDP